jgi:hypothetical protein
MRNWNNFLFLGSMPGLHESFNDWLHQAENQGIDYLVILTPMEDISEYSPEYYTWLASLTWLNLTQNLSFLNNDQEGIAPGYYEPETPKETQAPNSKFGFWEPRGIWYLPISDFGIPTEPVAQHFTIGVSAIAQVRDIAKVFVHCTAGIGRTGTFACSVLKKFGFSAQDAVTQINQVGSGPETPTQKNYVKNFA